jgi:hypothetical protein
MGNQREARRAWRTGLTQAQTEQSDFSASTSRVARLPVYGRSAALSRTRSLYPAFSASINVEQTRAQLAMALQMVYLFLPCSALSYGFFAALFGNLLSILFCFRGAWS